MSRAPNIGPRIFSEFLLTNTGGLNAAFSSGGTGTGASTGSTHGGTITAGPTTGKTWKVNKLLVFIAGDATGVASTGYADRVKLDDGIRVKIITSTGLAYYLGGTTREPITRNRDWGRFGNVKLADFHAGPDVMICEWNLPEINGETLTLDGDKGEKIALHFKKKGCTGITCHRYQVQGHEFSK